MKINLKNLIFRMQILCLFLAGTNFCYAEEVTTGSNVVPLKTILIKFGITMGSVLASLIIIWVLLSFYKYYYSGEIKKNQSKDLYGDTLDTPKSLDDAVLMFIDKNRL